MTKKPRKAIANPVDSATAAVKRVLDEHGCVLKTQVIIEGAKVDTRVFVALKEGG